MRPGVNGVNRGAAKQCWQGAIRGRNCGQGMAQGNVTRHGRHGTLRYSSSLANTDLGLCHPGDGVCAYPNGQTHSFAIDNASRGPTLGPENFDHLTKQRHRRNRGSRPIRSGPGGAIARQRPGASETARASFFSDLVACRRMLARRGWTLGVCSTCGDSAKSGGNPSPRLFGTVSPASRLAGYLPSSGTASSTPWISMHAWSWAGLAVVVFAAAVGAGRGPITSWMPAMGGRSRFWLAGRSPRLLAGWPSCGGASVVSLRSLCLWCHCRSRGDGAGPACYKNRHPGQLLAVAVVWTVGFGRRERDPVWEYRSSRSEPGLRWAAQCRRIAALAFVYAVLTRRAWWEKATNLGVVPIALLANII